MVWFPSTRRVLEVEGRAGLWRTGPCEELLLVQGPGRVLPAIIDHLQGWYDRSPFLLEDLASVRFAAIKPALINHGRV